MIFLLYVGTEGILLFRTELLTLKAPITTAADDIHKYFFSLFLRENKTLCFK